MKRGTKGAWGEKYDFVEESVGANVVKARIARGKTQVQLADFVGLEVKSLQRIEHGKGNCTARVLFTLAEVLKVQPNDLFVPGKVGPRKRGRPRKVVPIPEVKEEAK